MAKYLLSLKYSHLDSLVLTGNLPNSTWPWSNYWYLLHIWILWPTSSLVETEVDNVSRSISTKCERNPSIFTLDQSVRGYSSSKSKATISAIAANADCPASVGSSVALCACDIDERVFRAVADSMLNDSVRSLAHEIGLSPEAIYRSLASLSRSGRVQKVGYGQYRV